MLLSRPGTDITTVARDQRPGKLDAGVDQPSGARDAGAAADGAIRRTASLPAGESATSPPRPRRLPPLIVTVHGGPTEHVTRGVQPLRRTYWTSRGFAVLDVNYGGSTGYGRAYRDRLLGALGCRRRRRLLDRRAGDGRSSARPTPARLAITGGSAGGFTALACLTGTDTFGAGASHFGISDLVVLARRHAQVREPLPRQPGRAVPGAGGPLCREVADPARRPAVLPARAVPGDRGHRGPAEPGRADGSRRAGEGPAGRPGV